MKQILVIISIIICFVALSNGVEADVHAQDYEVCTVNDLDSANAIVVYCLNVPSISEAYTQVELPDQLKQYVEPDLQQVDKVPVGWHDIS